MASLKRKSKINKPRPLIKDDIPIPSKIYKNNSNIDLCIGVFYTNGVAFLVFIDIQVKYRSIIHIISHYEEECF